MALHFKNYNKILEAKTQHVFYPSIVAVLKNVKSPLKEKLSK